MMKMTMVVTVLVLAVVAVCGEASKNAMLLGGERITDMLTGRLMVRYKGRWGNVCDSNFTKTEGEVVCKELNPKFPYAAVIKGSAYSNGRKSSVKITAITCNGTEERVSQCTINNAGTCSSGHYVSLACSAVPIHQTDYKLSILGDSTSTKLSGPLKMSHLGFTGGVCADSWDDQDARVACRELSGFSSGIAYSHYRTYDTRNIKYLTSEFQCNGTEKRLLDCRHIETGNVTQCKSGHHAGVVCFNGPEATMTFRLRRSNKHYHESGTEVGRVEVKVNDQWGAVCVTHWNHPAAEVFCRSLHFSRGTVEDVPGDVPPHNGDVWDPQFRCRGNETDLNQCPHQGWKRLNPSACRVQAGAMCFGKATTTTKAIIDMTTEPDLSTTATVPAANADVIDIKEHAATTTTEAIIDTTTEPDPSTTATKPAAHADVIDIKEHAATTTTEAIIDLTTEPDLSTTATKPTVPADMISIEEHAATTTPEATTEPNVTTRTTMETRVAQVTSEYTKVPSKWLIIFLPVVGIAVVLVGVAVGVAIIRRDSVSPGNFFQFRRLRTPSPPQPMVKFSADVATVNIV